jgi:50S ribosomal subunit-associated GTPase HflX
VIDIGATKSLLVLNKIDLISSGDCTADWPIEAHTLRTSAVTGAGVAELIDAIGRLLVSDVPPAGAAVPIGADQLGALRAARGACVIGDAASAARALWMLLAASS